MSVWGYVWRVGSALLLLVFLVVAGLLFYASTPHFSQQVRQKLISVLEDATGGRVELQSLRWSVRHLAVEVDGLTIHGLEGPGGIALRPYRPAVCPGEDTFLHQCQARPGFSRGRPPLGSSHYLSRWPH